MKKIVNFKSLQLDERKLSAQFMFWLSILVPLISSIILSIPLWLQTKINLSAEGYANFLQAFKLPIGVLSLSIPFVAIVSHIHRTIQTSEQIQTTRKKNTADSFFSHNKFIIEALTKIPEEEIKVGGRKIKYKINNPYKLYDNLFKGSSYENGVVTEKFSEKIEDIKKSINSIAKSIQKANSTKPNKLNDIALLIEISKCIDFIENELTLNVIDYHRNKMIIGKLINNANILITDFHDEAEMKDRLSALTTFIEKIFQITNSQFSPPDILNNYIRERDFDHELFLSCFEEMILTNRRKHYSLETKSSKKLEKEHQEYTNDLYKMKNRITLFDKINNGRK